MRGGGGEKMSFFVHAQSIKLSTQGGGQKMAKFCPPTFGSDIFTARAPS
jgi:hypothetical protein